MGSRGPKPASAGTLKLRGSWRARARAHGPTPLSELADGKPRKPKGLSAEASTFWDEWTPKLIAMGVARKIDQPMLQAMCEMWGMYRAALVVVTANPTDKDARIALTSYKTAFEGIAARFGMSPRDRERLSVEGRPEAPSLADKYFSQIPVRNRNA